MATYVGYQAFVLSFSEALWDENRMHRNPRDGVVSGCDGNKLLPGRNRSAADAPLCDVEEVVETALSGLNRHKSTVISGWANWFTVEPNVFVLVRS